MLYEHNVNKFLVKDKSDIELEEYTKNFYKKVRMAGLRYNEEQFDDFLTELYMKEPDVYKEWHAALRKIPYYFIRQNTVLAANLVSSNNVGLLVTAYDMEKKKNSILSRTLPMKATSTTVNENKEKLLLELERLSLLMVSELEDNILRKAQEEFARCYGQYNDDPYLSDYYNGIIDNFETDMINKINEEYNKIEGIRSKISANDHLGTLVDNISHRNKNHPTSKFFKQTFK